MPTTQEEYEREEAIRNAGISEEEARLWEAGTDAMFSGEEFPADIRQELARFSGGGGLESGLEALEAFADVGGGGVQDKWIDVPLNDTWSVLMAQVPGAGAKFLDVMRSQSEVDEETMEAYHSGEAIWPGAVIFSRYLCIDPPIVPLAGKVVIELGAGLALPSVTAARLGASRVLVQDKMDAPLQEAIESGIKNDVADKLVTLRSDWRDLPTRLLSATEDSLRQFHDADVILGAEILFDEQAAVAVAETLGQLLRRKEQVAYLSDPYKREHRKAFAEACRDNGLDVQEKEIVTWEPEWDNRLETEEEWVCRLLTVRRI